MCRLLKGVVVTELLVAMAVIGCNHIDTPDSVGDNTMDSGVAVSKTDTSSDSSDTDPNESEPGGDTSIPYDASLSDPSLSTDDEILPELNCYLDVKDETELITTDAGTMELVGEPQQTTILFIFDKSGSMTSYWGDIPRWDAASEALINAVSQSNKLLEGKLRAGGILFPLPSECLVAEMSSGYQMEFSSADTFLTDWERAMDENRPDGATPLAEAFEVADRALAWECSEGRLDHLYKIIVITDGEPNCDVELEEIGELPAKWLKHGIKTYVFGLPGSTGAEDILNGIAEAGGTEQYIAPYREIPDGGTEETTPDELDDDIAIVVC